MRDKIKQRAAKQEWARKNVSKVRMANKLWREIHRSQYNAKARQRMARYRARHSA